MSMNKLQQQTNANIQAKANLIWEIATHLVGLFKPHEYGKVILPMTVLKRFDDALRPIKASVVEMAEKLDAQHVEGAARDGILCRISGFDFYNTSNYDFAKLIADPDNVEINFEAYLQGFSSNIKDIIDFSKVETIRYQHKALTDMFYSHPARYIDTERVACLEKARRYDYMAIEVSGEKLLEALGNG